MVVVVDEERGGLGALEKPGRHGGGPALSDPPPAMRGHSVDAFDLSAERRERSDVRLEDQRRALVVDEIAPALKSLRDPRAEEIRIARLRIVLRLFARHRR